MAKNIMAKNFSGKFYVYSVPLIVICAVIMYCLLYIHGLGWYDLPGHWKFCAYFLRGIDPYPYVGVSELPASVQDIGVISSSFNRTPWGLLLGNVFYFGFMSLKGAKLCFAVLSILSLVITSICIYIKAMNIYHDYKFAFISFILAVSSNAFLLSYYVGNEGGIIGSMLLLAWIFSDDYPVLTGILLALAMDKPQTALIICFAFLLEKRFAALITAALIDISAWFLVSLKTGSSMLLLLREFMSLNVGGEGFPLGIFTIFTDNPKISMFISMAAGILFVWVIDCMYSRNVKNCSNNFRLCFAFMARTFWCYLRTNDCYILLFPAIVCLYIAVHSEKIYQRILWGIACVYLNYGSFLRSLKPLAFITGYTPSLSDERLFTALYELTIIIIAVMIYMYFARKYKRIS